MSTTYQALQAAYNKAANKMKSALTWTTNTGRLYIAEANGTQYPVSQMEIHSFTLSEASGVGTYTATLTVPAGYTVLDILFAQTADWNSATAVLRIGDGDSATGYVNDKDLKNGGDFPDNAAGGVGVRASGLGGTYALGKYYAAAGTITILATTTAAGGTLGRTRVSVLMAPTGRTVTAATYAA